MSTTEATDRDLVLTRLIDAPREKLYRAWTEPALLMQWFAPLPYTTPHAELDVRAGGSNTVVMRGPDGADIPCSGVYLEVVPNERIVMTDAYTDAWQPSAKPFMTVILTFKVGDGKTSYTARVRHWTVADRETHEKMSFHEGWGQCADQLAALVAKLGDSRRRDAHRTARAAAFVAAVMTIVIIVIPACVGITAVAPPFARQWRGPRASRVFAGSPYDMTPATMSNERLRFS